MKNYKMDKFRQIKNLAEQCFEEQIELSSESEMKMDELLAGIRQMETPRYMCLQRESGGIMFDAVDRSLGNTQKYFTAIGRIYKQDSAS